MVSGGLRGLRQTPQQKLNKPRNYWDNKTLRRNRRRGWGWRKRATECNPTPALPTAALQSTQSGLCLSGQMVGLVAVKTMGKVSTHGLPQTPPHPPTHRMTFTWCISDAYVKQHVYYSDGAGGGVRSHRFGLFIHHHQMWLRRYNIWTLGKMSSDVRNAGQHSTGCHKPPLCFPASVTSARARSVVLPHC